MHAKTPETRCIAAGSSEVTSMYPKDREAAGGARTATARARWLAAPGVALALVLAGLGTPGCTDSEAEDVEALVAPQAAVAGDATMRMAAPPSLDELKTGLDLTSAQAEKLAPALARWHDAHEGRAEAFAERRPRMREEGGRPGPYGPGHGGGLGHGGGPGHGRGPGRDGGLEAGHPFGPGDSEPPILSFLADAAGVLEPSQMTALVDLIAGRQETPGRLGRFGPLGHPIVGHVRHLMNELDLDRDERREVRDAMHAYAEDLRELAIELHEGDLEASVARDRARESRLSLEKELSEILGSEDYARAKEIVSTEKASRAERQLDRLDEHLQRRTEFLDRVLALSDEQEAQVSAILTETRSHRQALLTGIRDGRIEPEDAMVETIEMHDATRTAIRGTLTNEQAALWDALQKLLPGDGPPIGRTRSR